MWSAMEPVMPFNSISLQTSINIKSLSESLDYFPRYSKITKTLSWLILIRCNVILTAS